MYTKTSETVAIPRKATEPTRGEFKSVSAVADLAGGGSERGSERMSVPLRQVIGWDFDRAPGTGCGASRMRPSDYVNHLFEGDCIEEMEKIPDGAIDMVLCDLPYGTTQNPWDSVIPLDKLWRAYRRVVKDDGAIVLTGQGAFTARLIISNESEFRYKIVWEKSKPTNFLNARRQPLRKHEDVCVFYRRQPSYNPQMTVGEPYSKGVRKDQLSGSYGNFKPVLVASRNGDRFPTDVVYFKTAESEGKVWHPTQKPVSLGQYLIRTFTKPGEIVLDNAFGSGSFLVAAVLEGRNYVGIEKNEEMRQFKKHPTDYVAVAQSRLREATRFQSLVPRLL